MRSPEDLVKIRVMLSAVISLDRERIVEDPAWAAIADNVNLTDPEQREQALFLYLASYLRRENIFGSSDIFMPSTNGPADIEIVSQEILQEQGALDSVVK